ncbi:hypothetical protein AB835_02860 [Candidatus Endobugula sertula]|uniref:HD-GYP domain-containing protein n=1 Tax=Candidatus Endobugula sertula TaxID=62101 RepID=A0A1D2QSK3_9GAMM|nr:hypothetical protein AB835_02860 [Candidatus Endobugula sertula]
MSEYTNYLANLQNRAKVIATEDIHSDQGVLLAKSGAEFNKKIYDNILKFKLLKPLEDSIAISNQLNAKSVYNRISQFIYTDPSLNAINESLGDKLVLQKCCLQLEKYPLLLQKLTVLSLEMREVFDQAILSSYLSYICGLTNQENQQTINEYFLAGLSHDIGLLHIDRYILNKKETLTADEWRKIQSHPIIGYEILKRIDNFPKKVSNAVLEHHENIDGTGYPRAKRSQDISHLGQAISLVDNVIAIYNKKFKPLNRSLRGLIPILQINMHSYFPEEISLILRTLKQVPESTIEEYATTIVNELVVHVKKEQDYVQRIIEEMIKVNKTIGLRHNDNEVSATQNIANNIIMIAHSAGLSDSNYNFWLQEIGHMESQSLYNEIEDTRLMLDEVVYHLQTYQKAASVFISKNSDNGIAKKIQSIINQFETTKRPSPSQALVAHWKSLQDKKITK